MTKILGAGLRPEQRQKTYIACLTEEMGQILWTKYVKLLTCMNLSGRTCTLNLLLGNIILPF